MNKQQLVTRRQAIKLRQLGFHDKTCACLIMAKDYQWIIFGYPSDSNRIKHKQMDGKTAHPFVSVPTVYEAVDWFERKLPASVFFSTAFEAQFSHKCKNRFATYRKIINALIKEYEKR